MTTITWIRSELPDMAVLRSVSIQAEVSILRSILAWQATNHHVVAIARLVRR